jgi:hypothetical protein
VFINTGVQRPPPRVNPIARPHRDDSRVKSSYWVNTIEIPGKNKEFVKVEVGMKVLWCRPLVGEDPQTRKLHSRWRGIRYREIHYGNAASMIPRTDASLMKNQRPRKPKETKWQGIQLGTRGTEVPNRERSRTSTFSTSCQANSPGDKRNQGHIERQTSLSGWNFTVTELIKVVFTGT